jgi:hypothetical protein
MTPKPVQSKIILPTDSDRNWLHLISDLLSESESKKVINQHTPSLEPQAASFTSRSRCIFQDNVLASTLWERLRPFYQSHQFIDEDGYRWHATHINNHFRFCKYVAGDGFTPHIDSEKLLDVNTQTMITVNIYLNTLPKAYEGATRIIDLVDADVPIENGVNQVHSSSKESTKAKEVITFNNTNYEILYSVYPTAGTAAIFPSNGPLHDSAPVKEGEKYLLRTDIAFQRTPGFAIHTDILRSLEGEDKEKMAREVGKKALEMASRLEDGGSISAWKWYKLAFQLCPYLER